MKNDETFTLVTHKKTRGRKSLGNKDNKLQPVRTFPFTERNSCQSTSTDKNKTLKLVQESVHEIKSSQLWKKLESILKENKKLTDPEIQRELICFGLGSLSSYISRNQLGLGLLIAQQFNIRISKYSDPCFTPQDIEVLLELGNQVVSENLEGKYLCNCNYVTVFYLPHCPKQLVNNLLWCNWNPEILENVILITNSFETIIERNPLRHLEQMKFSYRNTNIHPISLTIYLYRKQIQTCGYKEKLLHTIKTN
uniref:CSON013795 protein n=1 Tax=Culicoides sonorensis TaxID=179676 RepID=A0A336M8X1_CULSO